MDNAVEQRLKALEDHEQIAKLAATYCFLVDDGSFDALVERCFTEDACCDFRFAGGEIAPLVSRGRDQVKTFFAQVVPAALTEMTHTVHNHRIVVEGDSASGDCYFELTACDRATGEPVLGAGRYFDRYRRSGEGWRFAERRAEIFYITPLSEGWAKRRFIAALAARPR